MANFFSFINNIFSNRKKKSGPLAIPSYLLKSQDLQDISNYFKDVIRYYASIQHTIEGFNRELNRPNWVVIMCEELYEKINYFRNNTSKKSISLNVVFAKEEQATIDREYTIKLALFCAELCLKKSV